MWLGSQRLAIPSNRTVWSSYEILVIDLEKPGEHKRCLANTGVNKIRPIHTSHLVPSMGPIVSVVTSHGQ